VTFARKGHVWQIVTGTQCDTGRGQPTCQIATQSVQSYEHSTIHGCDRRTYTYNDAKHATQLKLRGVHLSEYKQFVKGSESTKSIESIGLQSSRFARLDRFQGLLICRDRPERSSHYSHFTVDYFCFDCHIYYRFIVVYLFCFYTNLWWIKILHASVNK